MKKIIRAGVAFVLLLTMIFCENQVSSKAASNKKLKTPKVKTSSTAENITLEWTTVKGAKGYSIQRNDGTGYKTIGKTKDTSFSDDDVYSDIRYNYRVRAYGKKSGKKVYSAWKKVSSETLGSDIKKISPERFDTYVNEIYDRIDEIRSSFTDIRKDANYIPGETYMGTAYYLSADGSALFGNLAGDPHDIFRNNMFLFSDINHPIAIITLEGAKSDWYRLNGEDSDGEVLMNTTIGSGNTFLYRPSKGNK